MIGKLPKSLKIDGEIFRIRSDYKIIFKIFEAFQDEELEDIEKWIVATFLLFKDFYCADDVFEAIENGFNFSEAQKQISWFISAGQPERKILEKPVYDWNKDEQMIFSAINKVAGKEVRKKKKRKKLHWWTFLGYFNEVGEGTFSFVVGIRNKLNKGKKLEKHEKEFLKNNKELVLLDIKRPMTEEEKKEDERIRALADEVLG